MKVLVVVASKHGSTREIAFAITEELRHCNIDADLRTINEAGDITPYNAVVLGSAVYMGKWLPEARNFVDIYHTRLSRVLIWLFSSGPLGNGNPEPYDPFRDIPLLGDLPIRDHHTFEGKLTPAKLNLGERVISAVVHSPSGDFRDWDDVRRWTQKVAAELHSLESPAVNERTRNNGKQSKSLLRG